jgi:hypothetical protein
MSGPDVCLDSERGGSHRHDHGNSGHEANSTLWTGTAARTSNAGPSACVHPTPALLCTPASPFGNHPVGPNVAALRLSHLLTLRGKPADKVPAVGNPVNPLPNLALTL